MITVREVLEALAEIWGEARRRWGEYRVVGVKERRGRIEALLIVGDRRVKVIVNKKTYSIRVYSGLRGQEIALKRMIQRSLGRRVERGEDKEPV